MVIVLADILNVSVCWAKEIEEILDQNLMRSTDAGKGSQRHLCFFLIVYIKYLLKL